MAKPEKRSAPLPDVERLGIERALWSDLYHFLLRAPWVVVFAIILAVFLAANGIFALLYDVVGGIEGARPGSLADSFFFSVQTLATIGYGKMAPVSLGAHILVSVEAVVGVMSFALVTGLVFAKFARPTARVMFSNVAVIYPRDGIPSLILRMANQRSTQIVEATIRVSLLRDELTVEGEDVRRIHDLRLVRSHTPFFSLTWSVIHPITPDSPLHGATLEELRSRDVLLLVSLIGTDETFAQSVSARHRYRPEDLVWNARFADLFQVAPDGHDQIDYQRFHEVIPLAPPTTG